MGKQVSWRAQNCMRFVCVPRDEEGRTPLCWEVFSLTCTECAGRPAGVCGDPERSWHAGGGRRTSPCRPLCLLNFVSGLHPLVKRKHAKHISITGTERKTVGRRVTTKGPRKATAVAWVGLGGGRMTVSEGKTHSAFSPTTYQRPERESSGKESRSTDVYR